MKRRFGLPIRARIMAISLVFVTLVIGFFGGHSAAERLIAFYTTAFMVLSFYAFIYFLVEMMSERTKKASEIFTNLTISMLSFYFFVLVVKNLVLG